MATPTNCFRISGGVHTLFDVKNICCLPGFFVHVRLINQYSADLVARDHASQLASALLLCSRDACDFCVSVAVTMSESTMTTGRLLR